MVISIEEKRDRDKLADVATDIPCSCRGSIRPFCPSNLWRQIFSPFAVAFRRDCSRNRRAARCSKTMRNLVYERYRAKRCDIIDYRYRNRLRHTVRPLSPLSRSKRRKLVVGSLYSMIDRWHGIRASVYYSRIDHERGRYWNRRRSILYESLEANDVLKKGIVAW